MNIELSDREFRLLLDMAYIGNWILNSTRGNDRIEDYDRIESKLFSQCASVGMNALLENKNGEVLPSRAFVEGGIHEAIMDYEDTVFYEILAEELARRDMSFEHISQENYDELAVRIDEYIAEFEKNGVDNISLN